jgi:redox-sensitive bicupin YhaK (pirin superfamily)
MTELDVRGIRAIAYAHEFPMGPFTVKQPLPSREVADASPFLLLHHAGPHVIDPANPMERLGPHPHRGFEPVTFLFKGQTRHRDSMGNHGYLNAGDVQWMTAGSGVLHSEGPTEEMLRDGGDLELIQLWVNLPAANKMMEPRYQDLPKATIPQHRLTGRGTPLELNVVAGTINGVTGPAQTCSPIVAMTATFDAGVDVDLHLPFETAIIYPLHGSLVINEDHMVNERYMVLFDEHPAPFRLRTTTAGSMLILSGTPLNEPVAMQGPFVMNTSAEVHAAYRDFIAGKMGTLED